MNGIKIEPKLWLVMAVNIVFQLTPILLIAFVIIIPSVNLLTDGISEDTQSLVTQTIESYIEDMGITGDYLLSLLIVWTFMLLAGLYLLLMYTSYMAGKVADKICGFVGKSIKSEKK